MAETQGTNDSSGPLREFDSVLRFLPSLTSGNLTVTVNRLPLLKIDTDSKSLSVEAAGLREGGLKLPERGRSESGSKANLRTVLSGSEKLAHSLSDIGWTLTLYDGKNELLSMGSGVSRLTGHLRINPLKLMKLVRALQGFR